jgi:beta-N-acetylglucosaminidase
MKFAKRLIAASIVGIATFNTSEQPIIPTVVKEIIVNPVEKELTNIQGVTKIIQQTRKGLSENFGIKGTKIENACSEIETSNYIDPVKLKKFAELNPNCRLILQNLKYLETIKLFYSNNSLELNLSTDINEEKLHKYINSRTKGKCPLTAQDFIKISNKYKIPVQLTIAMGLLESQLGTALVNNPKDINGPKINSRSVDTKNMFNVGVFDAGENKMAKEDSANNEFHLTWESGLDRFGKLLKDKYSPKNSDFLLRPFLVTNAMRPIGGRYAWNSEYTKTLAKLMVTIDSKISN